MVSTLDLAIVIIYLTTVLIVGFFLGRNEKAEGFFVNNRKTKVFLLIFSALSTSVGAGTILGVASAGYDTGISFGLTFAILTFFGWLFMAWVAPRIKEWSDRTESFTLGDFFMDRYGPRTRKLASSILLLSTFIVIGVQFVAFATLAQVVVGVNFELALLITGIITIIYTSVAGLKGDIYTDAIQFFVMLPVFFFVFFNGISRIGFSDLFSGIPKEFANPFNYAGPTFFVAGIVFGFVLLLTSMDVWQRIFAALDEKTARKALIWSGFLKLLVISSAVIFGLMAYKLVPGVEKDAALFELMKTLLPSGILGIGFASILAILMSSVDSMMIIGSATLTKDFYAGSKKRSDKQLLRFGRIGVLIFGIGGLAVALAFQDIVRLAVISVQIIGIFGPALVGGLFLKKHSESAAFWSILVGFLITIALLPRLPDTAAVPAIIVSTIVFIVLTKIYSKKRPVAQKGQ